MANSLHVVNRGKDGACYAIKNEDTGLWWIWCYVDRDFAHDMLAKVWPHEASDRAANWRASSDQLSLSRRRRS